MGAMNKLVARFAVKDRIGNMSYLKVSVDGHSAVHYSLISSNGIPLALANICTDIGIFPAFDHGDIVSQVQQALDSDQSYVTVAACEIPKKEKGKS